MGAPSRGSVPIGDRQWELPAQLPEAAKEPLLALAGSLGFLPADQAPGRPEFALADLLTVLRHTLGDHAAEEAIGADPAQLTFVMALLCSAYGYVAGGQP